MGDYETCLGYRDSQLLLLPIVFGYMTLPTRIGYFEAGDGKRPMWTVTEIIAPCIFTVQSLSDQNGEMIGFKEMVLITLKIALFKLNLKNSTNQKAARAREMK